MTTNDTETFINCSMTYNQTSEHHFCGVFESRPTKYATVVISCIFLFINIVIWYGAVWFEHFGSDQKRTLVNKLFTSLCWTAISGFFVSFTDNFRYIYGPLPVHACYVQIFVKNMFKTQALVIYDVIVLVRYVFIFWLKNPLAVNDDFWSSFLNFWIIGMSALVNFVHAYLPGPQPLQFYTCADLDPSLDLNQPKKKEGFIMAASIIMLVLVNLRICLAKRKCLLRTFFAKSKVHPMAQFTNGSDPIQEEVQLVDGTTLMLTLISMIAFFALNIKVNNLTVDQINVYPNYFYIYAVQLIAFQVFSLFVLTFLYSRHKQMIKTLFSALKGEL